ncbi:719_t:CDS:2, partial [Paraglomus occultum]
RGFIRTAGFVKHSFIPASGFLPDFFQSLSNRNASVLNDISKDDAFVDSMAFKFEMDMEDGPGTLEREKETATESVEVDPKLADIETLYGFIRFQSFDGFFKPTAEFSEFFSRGKDQNLFHGKDQDSVWSTCIALAYLETVMKDFKEEWELCYEKAQTALNELSGYDSSEKMMQDARKWVTEWHA